MTLLPPGAARAAVLAASQPGRLLSALGQGAARGEKIFSEVSLPASGKP